MSDSMIFCKCGLNMSESDFKHHFQKCTEFKKKFSPFDKELGNLLKKYTGDKDNLKILKFLLKSYISLLERKIEALYNKSLSNPII